MAEFTLLYTNYEVQNMEELNTAIEETTKANNELLNLKYIDHEEHTRNETEIKQMKAYAEEHLRYENQEMRT